MEELATRPRASHRGLAEAAAIFDEHHARGLFHGGQLVAMEHGRVLLDLAVGTARGVRASEGVERVAVTRETPFQIFSASKPAIAIAIAYLEDRGLLDVRAPIADVFPEFAAHRKEHITTLDVLQHRSGLMMRELTRDRIAEWGDWEAIVQALIDERPRYPRGTFAYQPFGYGWALAEVARRVSGKPLPDLLRDILPPPIADALRWGVPRAEISRVAKAYCEADRLLVDGFDLARNFDVNDSPEVMTAFVPGAGIITNARGLASFYDFVLRGASISPATLARYTTKQASGFDRTIGAWVSLGRGFAMGWWLPHPYGYWNTGRCFGHVGNFSCMGMADPQSGVALAIVTNTNRSLGDVMRRFAPITHRIRAACAARV
jgi:CubicO group peptidase (beta-lactamase class C family)